MDLLHTQAESNGTLQATNLYNIWLDPLHQRMFDTPITTNVAPKRQMKETLFARHHKTVEPMMIAKDMKATVHADAVNERNVVLYGCPPPISK